MVRFWQNHISVKCKWIFLRKNQINYSHLTVAVARSRVNSVPPATIQCKISYFCLCYIFLVFYVMFHWEIVDGSSRHGLLNTIKHIPQCKENNKFNKNANPTMLHSTSQLVENVMLHQPASGKCYIPPATLLHSTEQ